MTGQASARVWRWKSHFSTDAPFRSLEVLHLLPELLDHALELKPDIGQLDLIGFGGQRIRFAMEFLRQKIELAPDCAAVGEKFFRLSYMGSEPVEFFTNVGLRSKQDSFLVQPVRIEAVRGRHECGALLDGQRADCFGVSTSRFFSACRRG